MELSQVKARLNRLVYYNTGQMDFNGKTLKGFILTGCILRKDKRGFLHYEAELKDENSRNTITVPLKDVLNINQV